MSTKSYTSGTNESWRQLLSVLPAEVGDRISGLGPEFQLDLEEVRLRVGQPVELIDSRGSRFLSRLSGCTDDASQGFCLSPKHMEYVVQSVTQHSMYAVEEELRRGFITIPGGHRVGVAGRVVLGTDGRVKSIRAISSLNLRRARAILGVATPLRPHLANRSDGLPHSILVLSPPQCGKTTLIRDIARQWSENLIVRRTVPAKVSVVDERSEIAGCIEGVPQFRLGPRIDVLDGCPKAEGMLMAIRSLSPDVVVTDEIGRAEDAVAVLEALHAGVAVVTTAHARTLQDWRRRPYMDQLFTSRAFLRYVLLSRKSGPGTIESVLDETGRAIV